jgi:eukaryotic-like serine/threonine-protein kinase
MVKIPPSVEESGDVGEAGPVCPGCGAQLEKTAAGHLGCIVCLLRVGLDERAGSPQADRAEVADQFGTYAIARRDDGSPWELGRGAMGITFRALDTSLHRTVALKIIETNGTGDNNALRARFMREARAAAALRHENVATVYQFGIREETGQCFYAMELIEGETLEECVRRTGPLKAPVVIEIAQQVTAALAAAEKHGLIHRDLKPANLMLVAKEGEPTTARQNSRSHALLVKIIDFGLAKAIEGESDPMSLTRGGFAGTPAFASPEQFSDGPLDVRTDIYSLGATLWFALTGKRPFGGRSVEEIRGAQRSRGLPIEQLRAAHAPSGLISLLLSMLAFEPASRPGTQELSVRLRRCLWQARILARKTSLMVAAGVLVLLAALAFFGFRSLHDASQGPEKGASGVRSTANPEAREAYLKGRYFWDKRTADGLMKAGEYFKQAIALDPNYAEAYAGLGDSYHFLAGSNYDLRKDYFARSKEAYRKALELNPALAGAHASLGLVTMNYDWDWPAAEQEFKRAIKLDPGYATGHHWYAECLIALGRFDEGLREVERARELEPLSLIINTDMGKMLYYARRNDEAKKQLKETLNLDSNFAAAHLWLGWVCAEQKELDQAIAEFQTYGQLSGDKYVAGYVGFVYARMGKQREAEQIVEVLSQSSKSAATNVCLGLGDKDCAFAALELSYQLHDTAMTSLKVAPFYDSLRGDPRFVDLMRRVNLNP